MCSRRRGMHMTGIRNEGGIKIASQTHPHPNPPLEGGEKNY